VRAGTAVTYCSGTSTGAVYVTPEEVELTWPV
jgi:hypothetical protein